MFGIDIQFYNKYYSLSQVKKDKKKAPYFGILHSPSLNVSKNKIQESLLKASNKTIQEKKVFNVEVKKVLLTTYLLYQRSCELSKGRRQRPERVALILLST